MMIRNAPTLATALLFVVSGCASNAGSPAALPLTSSAQGAGQAPTALLQSPAATVQSNPPNLDIPTPASYDGGTEPSIGLAGSRFVEVHLGGANRKLWYHVGRLQNGAIFWGGSYNYDSGLAPAIAGNASSDVVEAHEDSAFLVTKMWYRVAKVHDTETIGWGPAYHYDNGAFPSLSVSGTNVVEVHQSSRVTHKLWYHVGNLNAAAKTIGWGASVEYDNGEHASVALNSSGAVVEVHGSGAALWYHVGTLDAAGKRIDWGPSRDIGGARGVLPSVALNDAGGVAVVYAGCDGMCTLSGSVNTAAKSISWGSPARTAVAAGPAISARIAMNDDYAAVAVDNGDGESSLHSGFSLETDRANWMGDRLSTLGHKPLSRIVFPGSHDAGMYHGNLGALGLTQDQNIYEQLRWGVRYFDLRPGKHLFIYHGPVTGPSTQTVLDDVKRFMQEGHREVIVLKFSHFDFEATNGNHTYTQLLNIIADTLGPWLYVNDTGKRLADIPLNTMLAKGGVVLAVLDVGTPPAHHTNEYTYRDWNAGSQNDPPKSAGDLSVYDVYANTDSYNTMKNDQLAKYARFDGKMEWNRELPTDMFLLSWTLTPCCFPRDVAPGPDSELGPVMATLGPNGYGRMPNVLYTDVVEWADPADVAIAANSRF